MNKMSKEDHELNEEVTKILDRSFEDIRKRVIALIVRRERRLGKTQQKKEAKEVNFKEHNAKEHSKEHGKEKKRETKRVRGGRHHSESESCSDESD